MKITRKKQQAKLELSCHDLPILRDIFSDLEKSLSEHEFETRVGFSKQQVINFLESLIQEISFSFEHEGSINMICSVEQVILLNNLLNQASKGIIDDLENKICVSREEFQNFLDLVNQVMKQMQFSRERKAIYFPPVGNFLTSEYNCYFDADAYQITFHMHKFFHFQNSNSVYYNKISLFIVLNLVFPDLARFSISSPRTMISLHDLHNFAEKFERYIELSKEELQESVIPWEIFRGSLFQVYALERGITSDGGEYVTINFMFKFSVLKKTIAQPFTGVQGNISLEKIRSFISSIRATLIALSYNQS